MTSTQHDNGLRTSFVTLNNGVKIPQVGFGVFQIADDDVVTPVKQAIELGYRSIDTAAAYGNEEGVGTALAQSGIARSELFVTTKVWNADHGFAATVEAFEKSLGLLKLDYVDMYLIHWPVPAQDKFIDTWRALESLYAEGRVRAIGVSNFTIGFLSRLLDETDVVPAVNQIELHPELPQVELREFGAARGIVTEAWSPLARGGVLQSPALAAVARGHGKTPAQVVLRWHLQLGNVVIPRSVNAGRIAENIDVFDFELTAEEMATMSGLSTGRRVGSDPQTMNVV